MRIHIVRPLRLPPPSAPRVLVAATTTGSVRFVSRCCDSVVPRVSSTADRPLGKGGSGCRTFASIVPLVLPVGRAAGATTTAVEATKTGGTTIAPLPPGNNDSSQWQRQSQSQSQRRRQGQGPGQGRQGRGQYSAHRQERNGRLILVRHGQSTWNVTDPARGLTARFTGWADVDLTDLGRDQAVAAGRALASYLADEAKNVLVVDNDGERMSLGVDCAFTSLLCRARDTLDLILREMDLVAPDYNYDDDDDDDDDDGRKGRRPGHTGDNGAGGSSSRYRYRIPVISSWRLNERHYGALVGLSKEGAERLYGREALGLWRYGWNTAPPPMHHDMVERWKREEHCSAVTFVMDPGAKGVENDYDRGVIVGNNVGIDVNVVDQRPHHPDAIGFRQSHSSSSGTQSTAQRRHIEQREMHIAASSSTSSSSSLSWSHSSSNGRRARDLAIWEKPSRDASTATADTVPPSSPNPRTNDPTISVRRASRMPPSESLGDTHDRILPLWESAVVPRLRQGQTVLVVAHANTLRSVLHSIDPLSVPREAMKHVKIPSAVPLVYEFRPASSLEKEKGEVLGGLVVVPPDIAQSVNGNDWEGGKAKKRWKLNGRWIETKDIGALSFCTPIGEKHLEHEIA